ncbi:MAG TPA: cation acetate symporter [Hydrogenophaga sp.]|jgi:cation/acetate symporter|uniref:sodium:solute symporter family protein n=1 Tax=Hydrogenophaga sp. TaxID=1904254 RepID=UPI0008D65A20|nr:sodium:solute symporter family protein [Hydrogenophaga sp.]MBU4180975.1 cation acetate symporter [Gammaproteobacteria bacterium]MDZ4304949.1 sodium:solute symporter family protein [Pseudomonas sp.]OGA79394.1 MAG: cation acetate symporter [Burkholderiales bacterium GWE1_65_30]OGA92950.1 MAG: cation acetate symporter [Burkholderiales bacterium GWF1_66_17]OGB27965.1 MAG: cation acetate symporter [Burkholderiales bacterium RIFCSPLOWO2_02_FULL_66_35]
MELQTTIYLFVGLSFALYLGIAFWARAGSTSEFYVAGGGVHPVTNGMATAADWMSAASFISMAGLISNMGYGGAVFLMGWTGGYVLLAMLLAPYLRKFGKFTVPEFIGDRFYSKAARNVAVLCLLIASLTYIIGQMTGVGVTFARFLGVSSDQGIYIGMAIVFMYAVFGGMKGITYTQVAQYMVLIAAYLVPAFFISLNLTGNFLPQLGLGSSMTGTDVSLLTKLDQVVTDLGFGQYTTSSAGSMLNMFFYTVSLMIGTAGLPHVIVRFFTVPKVADARSSAGWALVFIALLYTTAPAVGAMAKLNLHGTVNTAVGLTQTAEGIQVNADVVKANGDLYATEASLVYEQRPDWMKRWEKTGLLKWEDKNADGRIQYYNDATKNEVAKGKAEAAGWKGNELTVNADIIVLANPEIALLPNWVIALVAAGGLAAALSTAAGLLLAISSAISHDLIKGAIKPDISEKGELMAGKIAMAVAIFVAGWLGLNPPGFAAGTVALAFGIAASTIFPALMMGIFSRTVNDKGAIAGMLAGLFVTLFYVFAHKGLFFIKGTDYVDMVGGVNGFFTITPEAFGTVGAIVNFAVAYLVSKMGAPVPKHIQELVESVRVPKGAGVATGH